MRRKRFILASTSRKQQITEKGQGKKPKKKPWMNMLIGLLGHFFSFFFSFQLFIFLLIYLFHVLMYRPQFFLPLILQGPLPELNKPTLLFLRQHHTQGHVPWPHQSTLKTVPHRRDIDQLDVGNHLVVKKEESYNLKVNELYLVVSLNACYFLLN